MRTSLFPQFLLMLCLGLLATSAQGGDESLALVADGQPKARIVVQADAPGSVRFAAKELQHYIRQSTGATLPIKTAAGATGTAIYLGQSAQADEAGFTTDDLVADGSIRGVKQGNLFILGRDTDSADASWERQIPVNQALHQEHGTLYGVYSLLEDVLGVRWYAPGKIGEVVPAHRDVQVAVKTVRDEPAFTDRTFFPADILYYHRKNPKSFPDAKAYVSHTDELRRWQMRLRWGTQNQVQGSHSVAFWDYAKRFGKDHPQWFALQPNGQRALKTSRGAYLCWSQPGLIQEMAKDAIAYSKRQPASSRQIGNWHRVRFGDTVMIDPNDAYPGCQCDLCKANRKANPGRQYSEIMFGAVAEIAKKLQKEVPGAKVTTLAYMPKLLPPKTVTLPDNVAVRLCVSGANASFDPPAHITQLKLIKTWSKLLHGDLTLWTYNNIPRYVKALEGSVQVTPHRTSEFLRAVKPHVKGMFFQNNHTTQTQRNLDTYLNMRLLWNPDQDVDALLNDYYQGMYGPAGEPVSRLYDRLEALWETIITFNPPYTTNLYWYDSPPSVPNRAQLWEKILTAKVLEELDGILREAESAVKDQPTYARRVALLRSWLYDIMAERRQKFLGEKHATNRVKTTGQRTQAQADGFPAASAWQQAAWESLTPASDKHGHEVAGQFAMLWDDEHLYLKAKLQEPLLARSATASDRPRDDPGLWKDNDLELMLTPPDSPDVTYQIVVNDLGQLMDARRQGNQYQRDWNSQTQARVAKQQQQWVVELAVPLKQVGLTSPGELGSCAMNVVRHRSIQDLPDQFYGWSPAAKLGKWFDPVLWGEITFITSPTHAHAEKRNAN